MRANADKYTKNLHRHYLDDGGQATTEEARKAMSEQMRIKAPKNIGHWLQTMRRDIFNADFEAFVKTKKIKIHPLSK